MDITSLSSTYLEEATKIRKVFETSYGVGHDNECVVRAYQEKQPYWYASMYWQVQNPSQGNYIFGMQLH